MKIPFKSCLPVCLLWSCVLLAIKSENDTEFTKGHDKSCGPQDELITECVSFTKEKCPFVSSFAPVAENLVYSVGYRNVNHTIYITLFIQWKIPVQGVSKETLWGWQLRVIGKTGMVANKEMCIQINRKDILKQNVKFENQTVILPPVPAVYTIEVQGLPTWHGTHSKTVVTRTVKIIPDWCILHGSSYPCCDYHADNSYNYLNTSLLVDDSKNSLIITWNTSFPRELNISIAGFILKWISHPDDKCHANATVLLLHRSDFKLPKLQKKCGKYLLTVEVIFENPEQIGCKYSPGVTISYDPNIVPSAKQVKTSARNTALTVGFAVSACVVAIIIVIFTILKRRKRIKDKQLRLEQLIPHYPNYEKDFVKAFILTPNHCNVCKDVVHKLATLLMTTGRISCVVDMFVPNNEKQGGPVKWGERMIRESEYVLIPWLTPSSQTDSSCASRSDMNAKTFNLLLETILGQRLADPNSKRKLVPVYLDHCDIDVIPSNQRILHLYSLPSNVDDLIMDLIGKTSRRPDGTQVQFNDREYQNAKEALHRTVGRMKNHQCDKNRF